MTPTKLFQFLARLTIILLTSGCISPTSVSPTITPLMPTAAPTPTQTVEAHARKALGDAAFESAFAEGQKISLDDALALALKTVEEM